MMLELKGETGEENIERSLDERHNEKRHTQDDATCSHILLIEKDLREYPNIS